MTAPQSIVRLGRAASQRLMTDRCRITRKGQGEPVFNPETGLTEVPLPELVYSGPCQIFTSGPAAGQKNLGEATLYVQSQTLTVPVGTGMHIGDRVEITRSPLDPSNVDRTFTVTSFMRKTYAVSERAVIEEVAA